MPIRNRIAQSIKAKISDEKKNQIHIVKVFYNGADWNYTSYWRDKNIENYFLLL